MSTILLGDNLGKENEQVSLHLFIKGAFICTEIVVYCQCGFAIDYYCLCKQKLICCSSCLTVLHHLSKLHLYHVGWLLCAVMSLLAVLPMCHSSFLVAHKLVLMTRYIFLWPWIGFLVLPCKVTWCSPVCAASREPHQEWNYWEEPVSPCSLK